MSTLPYSALEKLPKMVDYTLEQTLAATLSKLDKKIVVLDDDPTGVQTVHDVSVYTNWDRQTLAEAFADPKQMFFILTNSRSFSALHTQQVHREIGQRLCEASVAANKDFILISRSDSTLRWHFPLETTTLRDTIEAESGRRFDGEILVPFFVEGGRYTIDNVHYVREGDTLVPAGETEFARDKSFGFSSSHMGAYVQEKTGGAFSKEDCTYISLQDLRSANLESIVSQLLAVHDFNKVIVNAASYDDVKMFAIAYGRAVDQGKTFLFRSAAAIPKVLGGVSDQPLLQKHQLCDDNNNGGIVLIGSHVNKTTRQLEQLKQKATQLECIEFNQHRVLEENGLEDEVARVVAAVERSITEGTSVVVYTRRERLDLDTDDEDAQLAMSTRISDSVTSIIGNLHVKPGFIIAKGGITSSDVGTKALGVKKALVMGQVQPGIPVWMTGAESKFPHMPYIIFPGNVGQEDTLYKIVETLI